MRPLKLELQYFGPYEHETVDFTQFPDQSLFLVAGNTGAGKTTIFDAMCYALFGQTTSDRDRSAAALRSDFAPADQETRVTFTFAHQGKDYQIMRRPKQVLKGRRGNLVEHNQAVSLRYPLTGNQPQEITKIKEADTFIGDLLNLTRDQFKQIVLLPQGKFRQFLDSDSNTKERLLRDLFNTGRYARWTQALREKLSQRKKGIEVQQTKLQSLKENVPDIETGINTTEWLHRVKGRVTELNEELAVKNTQERRQQGVIKDLTDRLHTEQELAANLAALAQLKKAATQLASRRAELTTVEKRVADLEWFQEHQTDYQRWHDGQNQLAKLDQGYQQATDLLADLTDQQGQLQGEEEAVRGQRPEIDQLHERCLTLQRQLPLFAEADCLAAELSQATTDYQQQRQKQESRQQLLAVKQDQLKELDQQLTAHQDLAQRRLDLTKQLGQQEKLVAEGERLDQLLLERDRQRERQQELAASLTRSTEAAKEAAATLTDLDDRFARQQIARLARKLKPGTPCPVCGSLDHPHLAVPAEDTGTLVTEEDVETATKAAQKQQQTVVHYQEQLATARQQVTKLDQQLTASQATVAQLLSADSLPAGWQQLIADRQQQLTTADHDLQKLEGAVQEWQQQATELRQKIATDQPAIQQLTTELAATQQELIRKQTVLQEKRGQLPADLATEQAAQKQLSKWQTRVTEFEQQEKRIQGQLQNVRQDLAAAQSRAGQFKHDASELRQTQVQRRADLVERLAERDSQLGWAFWQESAEYLVQLPKLRQQVKDFHDQLRDNQVQQEHLRDLVADQPAPDLTARRAQLAAAQQQAADQQQSIGQLKSRLTALQDNQQKVVKLLAQTDKADEQVNQLQTLTDVIAGNTENHLSLERYVLQAYFQDVLEAANIQLARLTNGRYQFELATESHGAGAKWSGLEVNVYDDNAGKTRSARTLSGGESFMASLALALALCQIIQEQSGGISIDALFIDEGFGSLDQQALADALQALQELEGHRMIGIISHVTELEDQIPDQLLVRSANGRSTVSYQHEL